MKKILFCSALAAVALSSCSSDDFMGDTPGNVQSNTSAINFDGGTGKITRTSNTGSAANMLGNEFKIYGVKSGTTSGSGYTPVFINYLLWYDDGKNTTTNKNGWEYVGENGNHGPNNVVNLTSPQTIKFWDYASADYRFVAGAPSTAFTFNAKDENDKSIASATIKGLGGHIEANPTGTTAGTANTFEPIYVAKPIVVAKKTGYQKPVQFEFVRQQSMVRVGIYETIPGYRIKDIKFYKQGDDGKLQVTTDNNIILTSATQDYFVGGSNVTGTITYNWNTLSYSLAYNASEGLKKSKNWYGGALADGVKATTSTNQTVSELYGTDLDMADNGYFTVMSTVAGTTAAPILIKCDYTLESEDNSGETIKVKGATAAIPAAYSKWETNTRYTYLFKISENTNGTTGDPTKPEDPAGLYPITFDAVVNDVNEGTITTITTPSITTYQKGSVVDNTIKYVANEKIDVTVTESTTGTKKDLHTDNPATVGHIAVYKFTDPITEAEVQVKGTTGGTAVTGGIVADNVYSFTPDGVGYHAIKYLTTAEDGNKPAAYTYKVVYVAATR